MNNLSNWIKQKRIWVIFLIGILVSSVEAYYQPESGRFMQRDPLGVNPAGGLTNPFSIIKQYSDGKNLYQYVKNNPSCYIDFDGLRPANPGDIEGGEYPPLPLPWVPSDDPEDDDSSFVGVEIHYFVGFGITHVKCKDKCGRPKNFIFIKYCGGGAIGYSIGGGVIWGMDGVRCKPEYYSGLFYEFALAKGLIGGGVDIGYNLDGSCSGTIEGGICIGQGRTVPKKGGLAKSSWCYYIQIGGDDYDYKTPEIPWAAPRGGLYF